MTERSEEARLLARLPEVFCELVEFARLGKFSFVCNVLEYREAIPPRGSHRAANQETPNAKYSSHLPQKSRHNLTSTL